MGLPSGMHGSHMNHIRLIDKQSYVKARYNYLQRLYRQISPLKCALKTKNASNLPPQSRPRPINLFKMHTKMPISFFESQRIKTTPVKKSFPIVTFIHLNSNLILLNTSPFSLTDLRFGNLHHNSTSLSYN